MSEPAKDLIKKMLTYKPENRISAADAYKHKWLEGNSGMAVDPGKSLEWARNMGRFHVTVWARRRLPRSCNRLL